MSFLLSDGTVNYRLWTGGDSISDLGRLIDLYMKAVRNCRDPSWAQRYLPAVEAIGEQLLALRRAAAKGPDPGVCCRGLLQGAPEHDFSGDKTHFYFNNNVWTLRGMVQLGTYLSGGVSPVKGAPPVNASLGAALLQEAKLFAPQLAAAVAASTVNHPPATTTATSTATATATATATTAAAQAKTEGGGEQPYFLPPFAALNFTPYTSMTESYKSSYTNFRFWSESLLADVLPRGVENATLDFHNERGGRIGGASRWTDRLDDMPTVGWGYGALTNNRTDDFHALLYGHMATYHSRGSFHTTEQLSFLGEGRYRSYLHWPDPTPDPTLDFAPGFVPRSEIGSVGGSVERGGRRVGAGAGAGAGVGERTTCVGCVGGYYGNEQDISFCIVSQVLMPKLTRWMLVFDDGYRGGNSGMPPSLADRPRVWIARAAPKRWFHVGSSGSSGSSEGGGGGEGRDGGGGGGFHVVAAPSLAGDVSFDARVSAAAAGEGGPGNASTASVVHAASAVSVTFDVRVSVPAAKATLPAGTFVDVGDVIWTLRWPGPLSQGHSASRDTTHNTHNTHNTTHGDTSLGGQPQCTGASCVIVAVDAEAGYVSVRVTGAVGAAGAAGAAGGAGTVTAFSVTATTTL